MEIKLDFIIDTLQNKTGLDIRKRTQVREYFLTRAIYYKLAKEYTFHSLSKIGAEVGKDHATVLHGIKKFDLEMKKYYPELYDLYENFRLRYPVELFNNDDDIPAPEEISSIVKRINDMDNQIKQRDAEVKRLNLEIDLMKHNGEDKRSDIVKLVSEISEDQLPLFMERITAMVKMMNTTTA
jgi:hypothetical protein